MTKKRGCGSLPQPYFLFQENSFTISVSLCFWGTINFLSRRPRESCKEARQREDKIAQASAEA
jgi:hypothetical protein